MHVIAAKAVAFKEALDPSFKKYQAAILDNAKALAEGLIEEGWRLVSGGTDNHLMLVDVKAKGMTGKDAEHILDSVGITVNKNTIPFDTEKPFVTSGIRLGTPALTTRGMGKAEMKKIASIIDIALVEKDFEKAKSMVQELTEAFPLYKEIRALYKGDSVNA